jgi:hypothetical protein
MSGSGFLALLDEYPSKQSMTVSRPGGLAGSLVGRADRPSTNFDFFSLRDPRRFRGASRPRVGIPAWAGATRGEDSEMAIHFLNVGSVRRSEGRSVISAAAYCSRSKMKDAKNLREVDFSAENDLVHSEILLPHGAAAR